MSPPKKISSLLEEARAEFLFSGFQLHCERQGKSLSLHGGVTSYWPETKPVEASTLFDIGSVTKALVTASSYARLSDRKAVSLEETLDLTLEEFRGQPLGQRTLGELLNHGSGLIGWYPLYQEKEIRDLAGFVKWLAGRGERVLEAPPRTKTIYSDLGFLLLGAVLERRFGELRELFEKEVGKPLGLTEIQYGPVADRLSVVATEYCLYRKRILQGEVFDENCFALGGVCAHAGLFATARGMAPFCREWLKAVKGQSDWLGKAIAQRMTRPAGLVTDSTWGYGWDTKSKTGSSAGERFSSTSFGHLGFPGCSIWLDPDAEGFAIFLTNRIHPSRRDERIRRLRPQLHDAIAEWWGG